MGNPGQLGCLLDTRKCDNRQKHSYHNPNSYRSLSLSNILGKTLEKVLLQQLLITLEGSNLFHGKNLYAYRNIYNTIHVIIQMIDCVKYLTWDTMELQL